MRAVVRVCTMPAIGELVAARYVNAMETSSEGEAGGEVARNAIMRQRGMV